MASSPPFPVARPCVTDVTDVTDEPTDAELVAQCRAGRQAAWSLLVRRYQRLVYTVPRRAGLGDDAAADVFQACFSRLFEHLDRIDDAARVRAWLVTTAKRETLRVLEARRRFVDLAPGDGDDDADDPMERIADPGPLPEQLLGELQEHDRLRRALDRIDARSRQFLELLFLQDEPLPYSEIAARLGIAEGSIGPTRARCLAKLRTALEALRDG
jgi:RNA polymerase sigma factor (sigma-70 family)